MRRYEYQLPRMAGLLRGLACAVLLGLLALSAAQPLRAQNTTPSAVTSDPEEAFSIRVDETLFQLEEAVSLIAGSLSKVSDRVQTLAINSMYFGRNVNSDFRRKAEVIILDKLFKANPNVKLVQCQECQKLETKINRGVLTLRKGIPSSEQRQALAEKLQVDGFIDIGMFQDDGQLTVYLKVIEAKTGAIILVDELAGRKAPRRDTLTFTFGEVQFPIEIDGSTTAHRALILGVTEAVRLTDRFSFSVDLTFYVDNNDNNTDPHLTLDSGLLLAPAVGFDVLRLPASTSRLVYYFGIGKLISPQLDYGNFAKTGFEFIVGDSLVVAFGVNYFQDATVEVTSGDISSEPKLAGGATLTGVGNELRFGYRF